MYTPEQVEAVCVEIEQKPVGTQKTLLALGMNTKEFWATLDGDEALRKRYTRAKELQAENLAEEIIEIADGESEDVQRDRLRVESRKWVAAKLLPKKYGEKLDVTSQGDKIAPAYIILSPEAAEKI
jgi:hypothetical protein